MFLALSIVCFSVSFYYDFAIDFQRAFTANQYLLTLLVGVGFLRLITSLKSESQEQVPKGKQSFLKTYFGVHLFGAVINMSALILVADKLYKRKALTTAQIVLLTRAFAADAYWSPFFVAFAAVSVYAPHLEIKMIILNGLFLAFVTFLFTYLEVFRNKKFDVQNFEGYPLSLNSLFLPFSLAFLVLFTNYFYPHTKIIILIPSFSIMLVLFVLSLQTNFLKALKDIKKHIVEELPNMKSEMSLFLVAGMFGISVSSILIGLHVNLPFETFSWIEASILLAIFILLGFVGVHPVITVAMIGSFLENVNHTLFAVSFLMAWSTTVATSPFSGLNLTIISRYQLNGKEIFMLNIFHTLKMYVVYVLCLFVLSKYLNI